jgi:tetratricopeptide (TPR) repeat protein
LISAMAYIQHNVYETTAIKEAKDDTVEYYLIGMLIEKNKYLETTEPNNYKINVKLGILYEIYKDSKNAEIQYKLAMSKAPYNEYEPVSKLSSLYIGQNKLYEAQKLMDDIKEKPDKKLIKYKAEIYFKLGEQYYNMGDYSTSIEKYQKSLFYYERIHSAKVEYLKECLASAYTYLAETYVDELKIQEAIEALLTANAYVDAPIIKYKLALLLMKNDPDSAYKYFQEVYKEEPSIIDFDVYFDFLTALSKAAEDIGNIAESELYSYKAKKFKEYFQANILSVDDVKVEMAEGAMKFNRWNKKCTLNLIFQLKNTSTNNLNSLFVYITFKDENGTITDYFNQIIDVKDPLKAGSISPIINIKTIKKQDKGEDIPSNIVAEVYVSKIENSYKIHLITLPIDEKKKEESNLIIKTKRFLQKLSLQY